MFVIPTGDALVTYIKDFTGSSNDAEIKQCIFLAELSMRNIELPALRSDPYAPENIGVADAQGYIPIPGDMNKPILFFKQGNPGGSTSSQTGPWIVYDRIGDRDIITQGMIAQLYLQPVNVPAVIRGKFSEVGDKYHFLPYIAEGDLINLYYYRAWPLLFAPADDTLISTTGTVGSISGAGPWTATITGMSTTTGLTVGDQITATAGTGSLGGGSGVYTVASIVSSTSITFTATGGTTPTAGTITNVNVTAQTVQSNAVLQTWPEGYVYATLREYYIKRHNPEDAAVYGSKFDNAWNQVEDQNNKGKWSGGHTRFTSVWQPRQYRQYNIK
ncbi:hypothetical protein UFOVP841_37 [uncultured Caudovirales phage]|uniref:Uncharacterized protein n=1 Tax=uncultured Caudovirales phage TaxID=2100421 RepID=A0A6J5P3H8_9CAUD|nr:hypothetical protein UFOVP841_37 [uncultured Caudovirales phage]